MLGPNTLPRGAYVALARQFGMSTTDVRNFLASGRAPKALQDAADLVRKGADDKRRVTVFRRQVRLASDAQLLAMLDENDQARQSSGLLRYFSQMDLVAGAFDHYCGAMTASVDSFAQDLGKAWQSPDLLPAVRTYVVLQLERAFERDDFARSLRKSDSEGVLPLGHDMDRQAWQRLLDIIQASPTYLADKTG